MLKKFIKFWQKPDIVPFKYPDMPLKFLVDQDKFEFTEDYYTPEATIPKGFITDGCSSPRWLQNLYPGYYKYFPAAVTHDYLYATAKYSRAECDMILRDIIRGREQMSFLYWLFMWLGVRVGGASHYDRK